MLEEAVKRAKDVLEIERVAAPRPGGPLGWLRTLGYWVYAYFEIGSGHYTPAERERRIVIRRRSDGATVATYDYSRNETEPLLLHFQQLVDDLEVMRLGEFCEAHVLELPRT